MSKFTIEQPTFKAVINALDFSRQLGYEEEPSFRFFCQCIHTVFWSSWYSQPEPRKPAFLEMLRQQMSLPLASLVYHHGSAERQRAELQRQTQAGESQSINGSELQATRQSPRIFQPK